MVFFKKKSGKLSSKLLFYHFSVKNVGKEEKLRILLKFHGGWEPEKEPHLKSILFSSFGIRKT